MSSIDILMQMNTVGKHEDKIAQKIKFRNNIIITRLQFKYNRQNSDRKKWSLAIRNQWNRQI